MRLLLILCAAALCSAEAPTISDAQRLEYRTLERDYWRLQVQVDQVVAKLQAKRDELMKVCGGRLDEAALTCTEAK